MKKQATSKRSAQAKAKILASPALRAVLKKAYSRVKRHVEETNAALDLAGHPPLNELAKDPDMGAVLSYYYAGQEQNLIAVLDARKRGLAFMPAEELAVVKTGAAAKRKQDTHCKQIAPHGGKARAHYKHAEIKDEVARFAKRNPKCSPWDAANALIRKGQPLDKYKRVTGLWSLMQRMAKDYGLPVAEFFGFTTHANG
jgi:hypothetical protein